MNLYEYTVKIEHSFLYGDASPDIYETTVVSDSIDNAAKLGLNRFLDSLGNQVCYTRIKTTKVTKGKPIYIERG